MAGVWPQLRRSPDGDCRGRYLGLASAGYVEDIESTTKTLPDRRHVDRDDRLGTYVRHR